ncbi:hypothetical protein CHUAL_002117 [Chamberlinius hualienensis]
MVYQHLILIFREEVRHSLAQLTSEVERLSNHASTSNTTGSNGGGKNSSNSVASNHSDDPRFDVSARISDMLGSTSASITEALLESDSQPASLLAPYGLIPPTPTTIVNDVGAHPREIQTSPDSDESHQVQIQTRILPIRTSSTSTTLVKHETVYEETLDKEDDEAHKSDVSGDSNEFVMSLAHPPPDGMWQRSDDVRDGQVNNKTTARQSRQHLQQKQSLTASSSTANKATASPRQVKNSYMENEWKKRRARELASARMRRFRERQKLKKAYLLANTNAQ